MVARLGRAVAAPPQTTRDSPAGKNTPGEPDVLNTLRIYANASGVKITRWMNGTPYAPVPGANGGLGGSNGTAEKPKPIPGGAAPIASSIEVAGPFNSIREFMYYLQRSPRLLNMTGIRW